MSMARTVALGLLAIFAGGCDPTSPGDLRGVGRIDWEHGTSTITQIGPSTLQWDLVFPTDQCCVSEGELTRSIRGDTVIIVPAFRYVPCPNRCMVAVRDSTSAVFPGATEVLFRIMGEDERGDLVTAFDTIVPLRPWGDGVPGS